MCERGRPANDVFSDNVDGSRAIQRYQTLVNAVNDGIYQLDTEGQFVAVNDSIVEETGYAREELLGEHVSILLDEEDVEFLEREIDARRETGVDEEDVEFEIETADGDRVLCEFRFSLLVSNGEFEGTVGTVQIIDERERDHDALASIWETHESISSVIDEADVGVFVLDEKFDIAWINESVEEYFGVNRADLIGRDKSAVIQETISNRVADPESFVEIVSTTYDDNSYVEQFECRITPGPGREGRWLEHRSKPIESGRYAGGRIELYYDITDRKESEQAHQQSEHRFQSLVDAVEEYAIFMLDTEGRVVSWNEGAERIKGYDAEHILGEHFSVFYTDTDRANDIPKRNLTQAREAGTIEDEGWRVHADGSTFWANVTITAIRDEGELQGYAKITRDMTDRREREQQLQRERDLTEQILETSPVGIAVTNPDGSVSRANERMETLLGVPSGGASEYVAGQRDVFDADGELLPVTERPAIRVFDTGEPLYDQEILLKQSDDQRTWLSVNATPITDERGEPKQVVTTATDITDLKELVERRKQALEEREKELAAVQLATNLFETGDQPIDELLDEFATTLPQSFRYPEHTAARISVGDHETTTEDYESQMPELTAHTRTANETPITISIVLLENSNIEAEELFLDEEQVLIDTLATLVKFYFERGEYIDELQAETRRLEQFAYAASHDLQEPLRMISSYLQLLDRRYGESLDEEGTEFLEFAVNGAERMREMIDGLLAYSRVETQGKPFEPIDLDEVLKDALADLEVRIDEQNAKITADSLPEVLGDTSQLRQVFQNLLDNAIEYSDGTPRIHVSAEKRDEEWIISVRDQGIGIDPKKTEHIFEVFHRLHNQDEHTGTGIGLALCERVIERHGGEIWVESEPGEGSTFSFTLPDASDRD
ncbi:PAS domain S-box protein [Halostagnicola sp. A-GB9-2]|uniref:PAS domain S-box protein n=1 Tax=Halostagnicola sp. A-GB9-2 TaxID=3048066 RepID=UPI0024BFAEC7|nr:PAS domain S-box protein [Halostagnicola sp. A-GB9-2]MDJ1430494.1 PAS domain S-box protein [Halostagnicola sp. A-GB9-2]